MKEEREREETERKKEGGRERDTLLSPQCREQKVNKTFLPSSFPSLILHFFTYFPVYLVFSLPSFSIYYHSSFVPLSFPSLELFYCLFLLLSLFGSIFSISFSALRIDSSNSSFSSVSPYSSFDYPAFSLPPSLPLCLSLSPMP